jgi:hypothetical protein
MVSATEPKRVSFEECVQLLKEFKDYDIMKAFMEADIDEPEGERFYDPIYEEEWG